MALLPVTPLIEGETLTSYLTRVGRYHMGMSVYEFLSFIELSRQDAMVPSDAVIRRVSDLTGQPVDRLLGAAIVSRGQRLRNYRREVFHAEFANFKQTSFCPACLLKDDAVGSPSGGIRVGRILWKIEPARICRRHGIGLVRRKNTHHSESFQNMAEVAPNTEALMDMVRKAEKQQPSVLQDYIENRFAGTAGPEWLDSQQIDYASRACEVLGLALTMGPSVVLKNVTYSEARRAGTVGFNFASRGAEGIKEALQSILAEFIEKGKPGGPQKVFGRLYKMVQFNTNEKPVGPIREILREFILDNFPIEAGTDLFGELVEVQLKHSVYSLARKTGEHPKTINRAVVLTGLLEGDPEKASANLVFNAEAGEALINQIQNSMPVLRLPEYLNCNRMQAEQLVRNGLIPRILQETASRTGVLKNVAIADVDLFLSRFTAGAERVESPTEGMLDIVSASAIARWPVMDIVKGVLEGTFKKMEIADHALKFKAVLVNPVEVRQALARQKADGRVSIEEAAAILGMRTGHLSTLVKTLDENKKPFIQEYFVENAKGARVQVFDPIDLDTFTERCVSLAVYAKTVGYGSKVLKAKLDNCDIQPIAPNTGRGGFYYRRAELVACDLT